MGGFFRVKKKAPEASILGVTVQRMVQNIDYELILGAKKDKDFGTVIIFGTGGSGPRYSGMLPPAFRRLTRRLRADSWKIPTVYACSAATGGNNPPI